MFFLKPENYNKQWLVENSDTASIVLFNFGYNIEYHFNLKKENNTWKIVKHNILMY